MTGKKDEMIKYNHRYHGHRPNYTNSNRWRNFSCCICQWCWLPVGITLSGTSLLLSLAIVITQKSFKTFTVKQEKHDAIKILAKSKLDSKANIISQAMQDRNISSIKFHIALQQVEKYCKLKSNIRNQAKAKVNRLLKNSEKNYLNKEEKKGKEDFL